MFINMKWFRKKWMYRFLCVSSIFSVCAWKQPEGSILNSTNQMDIRMDDDSFVTHANWRKAKQYFEILEIVINNENLTDREREQVLDLTKKLLNSFENVDLDTFKTNIETLDILYQNLGNFAGLYDPDSNTVTLGNSEQWVFQHELGHVAFLNSSGHVGQILPNHQVRHGFFLEEGINSLINFDLNQKDRYHYIRQYVKMLGEICGRERILNERAYGSKDSLLCYLYELNPKVHFQKVGDELEALVLYAQNGRGMDEAKTVVSLLPDFMDYYFSYLEKSWDVKPLLAIDSDTYQSWHMHSDMLKTTYYAFQIRKLYSYLTSEHHYKEASQCLEYFYTFYHGLENYFFIHYGEDGKSQFRNFYFRTYSNEKIYFAIQQSAYFAHQDFSIADDVYCKKYRR